MTPRILKNNATDFSRMGYGALNTTISCKVTEELNQAPTLEMSLLVTDPLLQFVTVGNIIAAQPNKNDNIQAFIIEEITKPINGVITIYAPHIAQHRTKLIPFSPITRRVNLDNTLQVLSGPAIENNNPFDFVRAADKNNVTADFSTDEPHSLRELMGGMEGSVLDIYGGEWSYDNFTITLHNHRGRDNGARVLYGRNMTDYTLDEYFDYNKSITGAVGFAWYTNENDVECIAISDPQYSALADNYPYKKTVTVDFTDYYQGSILISQSEINRHTAAWIRNRGAIASTVDISYNQIDNIGGEDIGMGDTLHIFNSVYNYETESRVVGLVFDVLAEEYETVTIGEQKTTLNEAIEGAAGSSTTIISGGGGGSGVEPSTTTPLMDGTATAGTESRYARGDHRHPTDTSRVSTAGDTITGDLIIRSTNIDMSASTPSSNQYGNSNFTVSDTNGTRMGYIRPVRYTSGTAGAQFFAVRGSTHNGIILSVDENDNRAVTVSDAAAWRTALGAAPLASPAFTGNPTAPTQSAGNNSTRIATTAYVQNEVSGKRVLGSQLINFSTSASVAVGSTGTATGNITAVTGATDYVVFAAWANYCTINNVTRSGMTLTATLRNVSNAAHTLAASVRVLAIG